MSEKIIVELTKEEIQALLEFLDLGVKAVGLKVAGNAAYLQNILVLAINRPPPPPKAEPPAAEKAPGQ